MLLAIIALSKATYPSSPSFSSSLTATISLSSPVSLGLIRRSFFLHPSGCLCPHSCLFVMHLPPKLPNLRANIIKSTLNLLANSDSDISLKKLDLILTTLSRGSSVHTATSAALRSHLLDKIRKEDSHGLSNAVTSSYRVRMVSLFI